MTSRSWANVSSWVKFFVWALLVVPFIVLTVFSPVSMVATMGRAAVDPIDAPHVIALWLERGYSWNPLTVLWLYPFAAPPIPLASQIPTQSASTASKDWALTLRAAHARYAVGQPVVVVVTLRNVSGSPQALPRGLGGAIIVLVMAPDGQIVWPPTNSAGLDFSDANLLAFCPGDEHQPCAAAGQSITRTLTFTPTTAGAYRMFARPGLSIFATAAGRNTTLRQVVARVDVGNAAVIGPRTTVVLGGWRVTLSADRRVYAPQDPIGIAVSFTNVSGAVGLPVALDPRVWGGGQRWPIVSIQREGAALPVATWHVSLPAAQLTVPCPAGTPLAIAGLAGGACVPPGGVVTSTIVWPQVAVPASGGGPISDPTGPLGGGWPSGPVPAGTYRIMVGVGTTHPMGRVTTPGYPYESVDHPVAVEVTLK